MSNKLKNIQNPVIMIESENGSQAIYINGKIKEQSTSINQKEMIAYCLEHNCQIIRVSADPESIDTNGLFPKTIDEFNDEDILNMEYCTA